MTIIHNVNEGRPGGMDSGLEYYTLRLRNVQYCCKSDGHTRHPNDLGCCSISPRHAKRLRTSCSVVSQGASRQGQGFIPMPSGVFSKAS